MTPATKNNLLAEAYAMRAWAYFYCIRVWGDVPMYTEPIENIANGIYRKRTDKNVIMKEIILPDLEQAYSLIPKTVSSSLPIARMNIATICTLLMDVHAWNHDYESVISTKQERVNPITKEGG